MIFSGSLCLHVACLTFYGGREAELVYSFFQNVWMTSYLYRNAMPSACFLYTKPQNCGACNSGDNYCQSYSIEIDPRGTCSHPEQIGVSITTPPT